METIINYLDNMFARLPKTKQMIEIKQELLVNMEDKYQELMQTGKSEHEAIGIVIAEFGNINELIDELDIDLDSENQEVSKMLTDQEINDFLEVNKKSGVRIGAGVSLIILGAALLILVTQLVDVGYITFFSERIADVVGLIPLFFLVAIAVGLFITASGMMEKFTFLEQDFVLSIQRMTELEQERQNFQSTYLKATITGVALCILSPMVLIITSVIHEEASGFGAAALLMTVSIAVFLFIYFGKIKEGYSKLLRLEEYTRPAKKSEERNKVISAVASIIWPLATVIFLISGLVYHQWHINWIIFPITGLLFAMFSGAYSILKSED